MLRSLILAGLLGAVMTAQGAAPAQSAAPRLAMISATIFDSVLDALGLRPSDPMITSSNGRLEAQSVDVASKYAGQIADVLVGEGDVVEPGQVIAHLDDRDAQAKLLGAQAQVLQAEASKQQAEAAVMQSQSAVDVAQTTYDRTEKLQAQSIASQGNLDDARNALASAQASLASAHAAVSNGNALIAAANAAVEQVKLALNDLTITAPIRGRVQFRLHEPGEVIAAGTPIVSLLDLTDVYMNLYLPADVVTTLSANDEARLIFDAVPQYVVPARVTFISPQAQFTPKSVETQSEREQLVFRVKLSIPKDLLTQFERYVKVGVRGVGYVRRDPTAQWPANLTVTLPQ